MSNKIIIKPYPKVENLEEELGVTTNLKYYNYKK